MPDADITLTIHADSTEAERKLDELERRAERGVDAAIAGGHGRERIADAIAQGRLPDLAGMAAPTATVGPAAGQGMAALAAADRDALVQAQQVRLAIEASKRGQQQAAADARQGLPPRSAFTQAGVERQLLQHYEAFNGPVNVAATNDPRLESFVNPFGFRGQLPGEVRSFLEGRPHLRRLFTVSDDRGSHGADAMAELGDDYWRLAEQAGSSDGGRRAVEAARRFAAESPDPSMQFLADLHPTLSGAGRTLDREATEAKRRETGNRRARVFRDDAASPFDLVRPSDLSLDDEFRFRGQTFTVGIDEDDNRVLRSSGGGTFALDALDAVPVERGTRRSRPPEMADLDDPFGEFERPKPAAAEPPRKPPETKATASAADDDDPVKRGAAVGQDLFGRPVYLPQGNDQGEMFGGSAADEAEARRAAEDRRRLSGQFDPKHTAEMFPAAQSPPPRDPPAIATAAPSPDDDDLRRRLQAGTAAAVEANVAAEQDRGYSGRGTPPLAGEPMLPGADAAPYPAARRRSEIPTVEGDAAPEFREPASHLPGVDAETFRRTLNKGVTELLFDKTLTPSQKQQLMAERREYDRQQKAAATPPAEPPVSPPPVAGGAGDAPGDDDGDRRRREDAERVAREAKREADNLRLRQQQEKDYRGNLARLRADVESAEEAGDTQRARAARQSFDTFASAAANFNVGPDDPLLASVPTFAERRRAKQDEQRREREANRDARARDRFGEKFENRLAGDAARDERQDRAEERTLRRLGSDDARDRVTAATDAYERRGDARPAAFRQAFRDEQGRQRVEAQIERVPEADRAGVRQRAGERMERTGEGIEQATRAVVAAYAKNAREAEAAARSHQQIAQANEREANRQTIEQTQARREAQRQERRVLDAALAGLDGPEQDRALQARRQQLSSRGPMQNVGGLMLPVDPIDREEAISLDRRQAALRQRSRGNTIGGMLNREVLPVGGFGLFFNIAFGAMEAVPAVQAAQAASRAAARGDDPRAVYEANIAAADAASGGMFGVLANLMVDPSGERRERAERMVAAADLRDEATVARTVANDVTRDLQQRAQLSTLEGRERALAEVEADRQQQVREATNVFDATAAAANASAKATMDQRMLDLEAERAKAQEQLSEARRAPAGLNAKGVQGAEAMVAEADAAIAAARQQYGQAKIDNESRRQAEVDEAAKAIQAAADALAAEIRKAGEAVNVRGEATIRANQLRARGQYAEADEVEREGQQRADRMLVNDEDRDLLRRTQRAENAARTAGDIRDYLTATRRYGNDLRTTMATLRGDDEAAQQIADDEARQREMQAVRERFGVGPLTDLLEYGVGRAADRRDELRRRTFRARRSALLGDTSAAVLADSGFTFEAQRASIAAQRQSLVDRFGDAQPAERVSAEVRLQAAERDVERQQQQRVGNLRLEGEVQQLSGEGRDAGAQAAVVRAQYLNRIRQAGSDEERSLIADLGREELRQLADDQRDGYALASVDPFGIASADASARAGRRRGGTPQSRAADIREQLAKFEQEADEAAGEATASGNLARQGIGRLQTAIDRENQRAEQSATASGGEDAQKIIDGLGRYLQQGNQLVRELIDATRSGVKWAD